MLLLLTLVYKYALERVPKRKTETGTKKVSLCAKSLAYFYPNVKSRKKFFSNNILK